MIMYSKGIKMQFKKWLQTKINAKIQSLSTKSGARHALPLPFNYSTNQLFNYSTIQPEVLLCQKIKN